MSVKVTGVTLFLKFHNLKAFVGASLYFCFGHYRTSNRKLNKWNEFHLFKKRKGNSISCFDIYNSRLLIVAFNCF